MVLQANLAVDQSSTVSTEPKFSWSATSTWLSNVPYILITCTFTMIMCGLWFSYQLNSLKSNLMVRKFYVWILIWFFHYICVFPSAYPCTLYWLKVLLVKDGTEQWRKGKQKQNQSSPKNISFRKLLIANQVEPRVKRRKKFRDLTRN